MSEIVAKLVVNGESEVETAEEETTEDEEEVDDEEYEVDDDDDEIDLNDDDVWDDSMLIKMYEASQKQINDELTKRFTGKLSDDSTEGKGASSTKTAVNNAGQQKKTTVAKSSKQLKSKQKATSSLTTKPLLQLSKPSILLQYNWREGAFCQATFSEDGIDYEAVIVSINPSDQTVLLRYVGYENEEVRSMSELKPSGGERVRQLQREMAIQDGYGQTVSYETDFEQPSLLLYRNKESNQHQLSIMPNSKHLLHQPGQYHNNLPLPTPSQIPDSNKQQLQLGLMPGSKNSNSSSSSSSSTTNTTTTTTTNCSNRIIPPPPPFLNSFSGVSGEQGFPGLGGASNAAGQLSSTPSFPEDDDDVLASMLMSWYMTGYHTGYYQARKDLMKG